jgi:hypothetical protein
MPEDAALGAEERAELERLRAEVAALRSQVQAGRATAGGRAGPPGRVTRQRWRAIVASVNLAAFIQTVKQRLAAAGLVS